MTIYVHDDDEVVRPALRRDVEEMAASMAASTALE